MIELIERLGRVVDERWRARDFDERAFPAIAAAALRELVPPGAIATADVIRWVLATERLPQQLDPASRFGQPPVTLYRAGRFAIDALFWMEGTTDIHQHAFSGAFHVLAGSSVHSRYTFRVAERVSSAVLIGELAFAGFELLAAGDTREIASGDHLIHGLFHLDRPSVTLVVRTFQDADAGPQYRYLPPSLAIDGFVDDPVLGRQLEVLSVLHAVDPPGYDAAAAAHAAGADFYALYRIARHYLVRVQDEARLRALVDHGRPRHGARVDLLPPVLLEQARLASIAAKRALLPGADHRYFLALLMNLPDRRAVLEAIAARHPGDDPVALATGWILDLADAMLGRVGAADDSSAIVDGVLRGFGGDALVAHLKAEFDDDDVERMRDDIAAIERSLREAPMLRRLW